MRESRRLLGLLIIGVFLALPVIARAAEKPSGRFLFQPMFIWATGEASHQGTGYLIESEGKFYGVTSIHFLDFGAGGLYEAIWLDIPSSRPVVTFTASVGKPGMTAIEIYRDIAHDFLLMPLAGLPADSVALKVEDVASYPAQTKLWFPNKSPEQKSGYEWIEAEVIKDEGHLIKVKLLSKITLKSQSGTPFLNQATGHVVGMLMGGDENEIYLCPARSIAKRLKEAPPAVPLMESIRKE